MSSHSQFKNIMHRKGKQDKVRSKVFGKLAREITVAAKLGLPDPAFNPRLRAAILAALAEHRPTATTTPHVQKAYDHDANAQTATTAEPTEPRPAKRPPPGNTTPATTVHDGDVA